MLSIAIIDDDLDHAQTLAYELEQFLSDMPFTYNIITSTTISFDIEQHLDVNIIFLNYHIIPNYASQLEIKYGNHDLSPVFYIYDYHYRNRKDVHVNHLMAYLSKGHFIDDLNHSFPYSIEAIYKNQYLTYHRHHTLKFIAYEDILYVTKDKDASLITSLRHVHKASDHFELLGCTLPNDDFFFSTSNRVVNSHHVKAVDDHKVFMDNGDVLTLDPKGKNLYDLIIKESSNDDS